MNYLSKQSIFEFQGNVFDLLATEIFNIINGSGRKVTLWDADNNLVYNPKESRRLFAEPDKLMIRIFESGHDSSVKMYLGNTTPLEKLMMLIEQLRLSATKYGVLFEVRRYGKEINPKHFAHITSDVEESIVKSSSMVNIFEIMNIAHKDLNWAVLINDGHLLEEIKVFIDTNFKLIKEDPSKAGNKFIEERKENKMRKTPVTERTHKLKIGQNTTLFVYEQIVKNNRVLSKIVIEHQGKKLRYPNNSLHGAKAMGRHLAEGGRPLSNLGKYIVNLSERLEKLQQLGRYVKMNESSIRNVSSFVRVMSESVTKAKKELDFIFDRKTYSHALKESMKGTLPAIVNESNHSGVRKLAESLKINNGKIFNTVPVLFNIISKINEDAPLRRGAEISKVVSDTDYGIGMAPEKPRSDLNVHAMLSKANSDDFNIGRFTHDVESLESEMSHLEPNIIHDRSNGFSLLMDKVKTGLRLPPKIRPYAEFLAQVVEDDQMSVYLANLSHAKTITPQDKELVVTLFKNFKERALPEYKKLEGRFAACAAQGAPQGSDKHKAMVAARRAGTPEIAKLEQWFNNFDPDKILTEGPFSINPKFKASMFGGGASYNDEWTGPDEEPIDLGFGGDDLGDDPIPGIDDKLGGDDDLGFGMDDLGDDPIPGLDDDLEVNDLGDDPIPGIDDELGGEDDLGFELGDDPIPGLDDDLEVDEESWMKPHGSIVDDEEYAGLSGLGLDDDGLGIDGEDAGIPGDFDDLHSEGELGLSLPRDRFGLGESFQQPTRRLRDANVQGGFKKEIIQRKPKNDPNEDDELNRFLVLAGRKK